MRSSDMAPVAGTVVVDVPLPALWQAFAQAAFWPRWNRSMFRVHNRDLVEGDTLRWVFRPIRRWYPYLLPATARIVEVRDEVRVTWEVTALPGFYARHTYHMRDVGEGQTEFGSWEKASGVAFRLLRWFWIPHFVFVRDRSLEGARLLERWRQRDGSLAAVTAPRRPRLLIVLPTLAALGGLAGLVWFMQTYVRQRAVVLAPGVVAVLGGGGNSLVVAGDEEALLIDPKFPPGAQWLRKWIGRHIARPVRTIVNTHYHYDHTQGNALYPGARIYAHRNVPELMRAEDPDYWDRHVAGLPAELVDDAASLSVGDVALELIHPGPAHTRGDLWVRLPRYNIVVTGDLLFHTYYPFLDTGPGGASIPGIIASLRHLADSHPGAIFVPGHGPLAHADDLRHAADYLEHLQQKVERARAAGLSEDEAVAQVKLRDRGLSILPSFHGRRLSWATAKANVRWAYQIATGQGNGRSP